MLSETDLKNQIKDYLAIRRIFNFPLTAGIASYKGQPDRILFYKNQAVFCEIKKPNGKLSEHQIKFMDNCKLNGIEYWVIRDLCELEQNLLNLDRL